MACRRLDNVFFSSVNRFFPTFLSPLLRCPPFTPSVPAFPLSLFGWTSQGRESLSFLSFSAAEKRYSRLAAQSGQKMTQLLDFCSFEKAQKVGFTLGRPCHDSTMTAVTRESKVSVFKKCFLKSNRHPVDLATLPARVRLLRPMGIFCGSGHGPEGANGRSRMRCTARACAVTDRPGALTSSKGGRRMIWVLQKKFFGSRPACLLSLRPHLGQF